MSERPPRKDRPRRPGQSPNRPGAGAKDGPRDRTRDRQQPRGDGREDGGRRPGGKPPQGSGPRRPGTERPGAERRGADRPNPNELWLFGEHAVLAAIRNQRRTCHQLLASEDGMPRIRDAAAKRGLRITPLPNAEIAKRLPRGAVHQGVAMQVAPLPPLQLERVIAIQPATSLLLALDQVTDPRNFGAILRSAVALGVGAVIVPERRSADLGGTTAKAASGALDMLPIVEVVNLARALARLKEAGFRISGLDAEGSTTIDKAPPMPRRVLVIGSEGEGMRRLTTESCDETLSIPIDRRIDSLNVSVAASLALYALTRKATTP
jgi:23S rRNA (guanosine2251-2'-O)-methyltransferase